LNLRQLIERTAPLDRVFPGGVLADLADFQAASEQAYLRSNPATVRRKNCSRAAMLAFSWRTPSSVIEGGRAGLAINIATPLFTD
jgi:hypothetical protein